MAQGLLGHSTTESGWEMASRRVKERERIGCGPAEKFKHQENSSCNEGQHNDQETLPPLSGDMHHVCG
jgi:hypothetical protein